MRAINATVVALAAGSVAASGLGCRPAARASRPPDAGAPLTVYVPGDQADRVLGPLQRVAASHRWALSVRTDSAARLEADLTLVDSAGRMIARVREASPVAAQARQLADAVLR